MWWLTWAWVKHVMATSGLSANTTFPVTTELFSFVLVVSLKCTSAPCHPYPGQCIVNSTSSVMIAWYSCTVICRLAPGCRWQAVYWLDLDSEHMLP